MRFMWWTVGTGLRAWKCALSFSRNVCGDADGSAENFPGIRNVSNSISAGEAPRSHLNAVLNPRSTVGNKVSHDVAGLHISAAFSLRCIVQGDRWTADGMAKSVSSLLRLSEQIS
ncbi:hypothetical protein P5V15_002749 [Pogonomyrmex californicus]